MSAKQIACRISDRLTIESSVILGRRRAAPKRVFTMKPTKEELLDIIYQSLEEVNEQLPNGQQIQKSPDAALVGRAGGLDSLGFVNFLALVEEKCAHKYGIALSLTDTSSSEDDSFEDVGKFANSLFHRLNKTSSVEL